MILETTREIKYQLLLRVLQPLGAKTWPIIYNKIRLAALWESS